MIEANHTPTPYSPEGRVNYRLRALACSEGAFARLCGGIVGGTRLNLALKDSRRSLENPILERLFERLDQMESLQADVNRAATERGLDSIPLAWDKTELISNALTVRLMHSIEHESGNDQFQSLNDKATKAVANV